MARPSRAGGKRGAAKTGNASPAKGSTTAKTRRGVAADATRAKGHSVSDLRKDLKEAREQHAAMAEILKVIASSPSDTTPVFEAIATSAKRLLGGFSTAVFRIFDDTVHLGAFTPVSPVADAALQADFPQPVENFEAFQLAQHGKPIAIADTEEVSHGPLRDIARLHGFRSMLWVPTVNGGVTIGIISVTRAEPGAFASHQIQLLQTFADQAVIAIENARLFNEVRSKTHDLEESLEYQTATSDVLSVISRSPHDLQPVLDSVVETAGRLCKAYDTSVALRQGDTVKLGAHFGAIPIRLEWPINRDFVTTRALLDKVTIHVHDAWAPGGDFPEGHKMALKMGFRTILAVPLVRDGVGVGSLVLRRSEVLPFSEKQIALLQTFADQAVIAINNVGLFAEVQARTKELSASLDELRTAQDRLVQTEKLASLGQLTAGIAHEIKNPLNFVNNFSSLSAELVDELDETLAPAALERKMRDEVGELTAMLKSNLEKVVQHGKRADSIVRNMLLHSREGSGERRSTDINGLVGESLNLAYHGARAEKADFSITLKHDLDPEAGALDLYPQEITRALLNFISNGFYAATRRKVEAGDGVFEPVLSAATRNLGKTVEIRIRDNGTGIPPEVKEKMFNPFFTTKPAGEGTGLGLSISHDIIVKQHGGRIDVETEPGEFTEVLITLPRDNRTAAGEKPK